MSRTELNETTYGRPLQRTLPHIIHTDEKCEQLTSELMRLDETEGPSPEDKEISELLTIRTGE